MERLAIDGYGRSLSTELGQIVVKEKGKIIERKNPADLRQIVFSGKGSVTSEAIKLLGKHGVDVIFLDYDGSIIARVSPPELRTVAVRKEQYYAYKDERGLILSREFVKAKMRNQSAILGSLAKRRKDTNANTAQDLQNAKSQIEALLKEIEKIQGTCIDDVRQSLQGFEGNSARIYWISLSATFPPDLGFQGRKVCSRSNK